MNKNDNIIINENKIKIKGKNFLRYYNDEEYRNEIINKYSHIILVYNFIDDKEVTIQNLDVFANIREVCIFNNQEITDVTPLKHALYVDLSGCRNIINLNELKNVKKLKLICCDILSYGIDKLTALEKLNMSWSHIKNVNRQGGAFSRTFCLDIAAHHTRSLLSMFRLGGATGL